MGSVEPLIVNDVALADAFSQIPAVAVFNMRSYIGVPIVLQSGRVFGTLCALDRRLQQKTQEDLDLLLILARLLASQLDRQERGVLEERQRLAREIHDTIAQTLSGLAIELETHAHAVRRVDPKLATTVEAMRLQTQDALRDVRSAIWNLQPGELAGRSLAEAVAAELQATIPGHVDGVLEVRGTPIDLSPAISSALFRIAQEALTNVRKHSQASSVVVTIDYGADAVTLYVDDDGRGPHAQSPFVGGTGGFGLTSMRERARLAGGALSVTPRAGGGTSVVCALPLTWVPPLASGDGQAESTESGATPEASSIRVVVIDDHMVVREGLRRMLDSVDGISVIAVAGDGDDGLVAIEQAHPDVVLLDLQMPRVSGINVLEELRSRGIAARVIVVTSFTQDEMIFQAIRLGARGYLLKDTSAAELQRAVETVANGGTLITPVAAARLAERVQRVDRLTEREREVLILLAEGLRNKEIATRLGTSEKTVQFHIANLFGKLDVGTRTEAVRVARERGILSPLN
jgi:DNA-binding NarL/FixJ family response regulator/signal transduction histidine kinase